MAVIVADTDVLIDFLRSKGPRMKEVEEALRVGQLATTVITAFELQSGSQKQSQFNEMRIFLEALHIFPLTDEAASRAARVRRSLEKEGRGIGMADYLIAGICLEESVSLLTNNKKHFERVSGLTLI